jgi:DNA polymerase-3 subunit delta'
MQTYLLVSSEAKFIDAKIASIKSQLALSPYNTHIFSPSNSLGIDEVKTIKTILSQKPFAGGDRLIIINNIEKATTEAANALLKILEEPPSQTFIILTTSNLHQILPTITSRCQIVSDREQTPQQIGSDFDKEMKLLKQILTSRPGERIIISLSAGKSKEEVENFLDSLLMLCRQLLYQNEEKELGIRREEVALLINKIIAAKGYLERNVNYKATLDILLLGFPKLVPRLRLGVNP